MAAFSNQAFDILAFDEMAFDIGTPVLDPILPTRNDVRTLSSNRQNRLNKGGARSVRRSNSNPRLNRTK